ncbi:MAG TPA: glycoside hydrolase 43 family protein [Polyangiaceae bacterium]|nr:glycoside hydrolase 43 family protein [Polyangiaceae bacterium]
MNKLLPRTLTPAPKAHHVVRLPSRLALVLSTLYFYALPGCWEEGNGGSATVAGGGASSDGSTLGSSTTGSVGSTGVTQTVGTSSVSAGGAGTSNTAASTGMTSTGDTTGGGGSLPTGGSSNGGASSTGVGGATGTGGSGGTTPAVCPETYENPLIWEDLPDVEVIRVDDTYYYTASTFHHSPGAPVLRSYDLVHWEYVSHSVPVLDFDASYDLSGDRSYVNGIWASTLQYRASNETFYWMGCMHGVGGGWVFTAKSPEGPWEKHRGGCYYDMGLLIDDDDKMYVAYGNNTISVAELSDDGLSQVRSEVVLETPSSVGGPLEGSRFYKRDGAYYIFLTQYANGEWVLKSTNGPMGPYEGPREFAVRLPYAGAAGSGASPHQGGIVETQNGEWYYIGFNDSYPAGRIPVMIPMTWGDDGWPSVNLVDGEFGGSYPFPDLPCGSNKVKAWNPKDTFDDAELAPEWEWNHNPDDSKWSVGDGLVLQTATVTDDLYSVRNMLTRRIEGPASFATIELDFSAMQDGDVAGIAAFRDRSAWIGVKKTNAGARVVMTNGVDMNTSWETTSTGSEVAGADISGTKIWLRVEADVRSSGGGTATFSYSMDGSQFESLGNTLTMNKDWQFFMGYRFGIFNYATEALGGSVKVLSFQAVKQ